MSTLRAVLEEALGTQKSALAASRRTAHTIGSDSHQVALQLEVANQDLLAAIRAHDAEPISASA